MPTVTRTPPTHGSYQQDLSHYNPTFEKAFVCAISDGPFKKRFPRLNSNLPQQTPSHSVFDRHEIAYLGETLKTLGVKGHILDCQQVIRTIENNCFPLGSDKLIREKNIKTISVLVDQAKRHVEDHISSKLKELDTDKKNRMHKSHSNTNDSPYNVISSTVKNILSRVDEVLHDVTQSTSLDKESVSFQQRKNDKLVQQTDTTSIHLDNEIKNSNGINRSIIIEPFSINNSPDVISMVGDGIVNNFVDSPLDKKMNVTKTSKHNILVNSNIDDKETKPDNNLMFNSEVFSTRLRHGYDNKVLLKETESTEKSFESAFSLALCRGPLKKRFQRLDCNFPQPQPIQTAFDGDEIAFIGQTLREFGLKGYVLDNDQVIKAVQKSISLGSDINIKAKNVKIIEALVRQSKVYVKEQMLMQLKQSRMNEELRGKKFQYLDKGLSLKTVHFVAKDIIDTTNHVGREIKRVLSSSNDTPLPQDRKNALLLEESTTNPVFLDCNISDENDIDCDIKIEPFSIDNSCDYDELLEEIPVNNVTNVKDGRGTNLNHTKIGNEIDLNSNNDDQDETPKDTLSFTSETTLGRVRSGFDITVSPTENEQVMWRNIPERYRSGYVSINQFSSNNLDIDSSLLETKDDDPDNI